MCKLEDKDKKKNHGNSKEKSDLSNAGELQ